MAILFCLAGCVESNPDYHVFSQESDSGWRMDLSSARDMEDPYAVRITEVSPPSGPTSGNITLTISGANFASGNGLIVRIAGLRAGKVAWVSTKEITCLLPAKPGALGPVDVAVTNPDGMAGSAAAFSYYASQIAFGIPRTVPVEQNPRFVAVGDLNADGKADAVVSNMDSNTVGILLGDGSGAFLPEQAYRVGQKPRGSVIADFNGDGKPDVAAADSGENAVSLLLGDGHGAFQPAMPVASNPTPFGVAAGDFNGDGRMDLAVVNTHVDTTAAVLYGHGDGSFEMGGTFALNAGSNTVSVADMNGDAKPDIVCLSDTVSVLVNRGDRTFTPTTFTVVMGSTPLATAVADLNGDLVPDAAISYGNGSGFNGVAVALNSGNAMLSTSHAYDNKGGSSDRADAVAIGDMDGDGWPDIVLLNTIAGFALYRNHGDGTFDEPINTQAVVGPRHLGLADFNNDGRPDIITANSNNTVTVFLNASQ